MWNDKYKAITCLIKDTILLVLNRLNPQLRRNTDFGEEANYFIIVFGGVVVIVTKNSNKTYLSLQS